MATSELRHTLRFSLLSFSLFRNSFQLLKKSWNLTTQPLKTKILGGRKNIFGDLEKISSVIWKKIYLRKRRDQDEGIAAFHIEKLLNALLGKTP